MDTVDKCSRLAREIRGWFEAGISLDMHAKRYMDACLPGISIEEVGHRLTDAPDLEIAPLMDLIFFPDEALQERLEPLIENQCYDSDDEAMVAELLEGQPLRTMLLGSEGRAGVTFEIPLSVFAPFVRRLTISRRIPSPLTETISDIHPPETATGIKVKLRNTRFAFSEPVTDFLISFFMGMDSRDPEFFTCLELILALLGEQGEETDPFFLLRLKIDTLSKAKEAAALFEKQLRGSNMETLMQMGVRPPEISVSGAAEKIARLDRIGRAVALGGVLFRRKL